MALAKRHNVCECRSLENNLFHDIQILIIYYLIAGA